jgi:hypothetical protein
MKVLSLLQAFTFVLSQHRDLAGDDQSGGSDYQIDFSPTQANEDGYKFHYGNYGLDWGFGIDGLNDEDNFCGIEGSQTPVNLMKALGSYGWAYGFPSPKADDAIVKSYSNLKTDTKVQFDYSAIKVKLDGESNPEMYF